MKYYLNDPSTLELFEEIQPPAAPSSPVFTVNGANIVDNFQEGTSGFRANGCFVSIANSINYIQSIVGPNHLTRWASTKNLIVLPEAGKDMNAYYNRSHLKFFYDFDRSLNRTVYTSDSRDVV
jgi:hypothetical protein